MTNDIARTKEEVFIGRLGSGGKIIHWWGGLGHRNRLNSRGCLSKLGLGRARQAAGCFRTVGKIPACSLRRAVRCDSISTWPAFSRHEFKAADRSVRSTRAKLQDGGGQLERFS